MAMTKRPAPLAVPLKMRSPRRPVEARPPSKGPCPSGARSLPTEETPVVFGMSAVIVISASAAGSGQGADRGVDLSLDVGRKRCVADGHELGLLSGRGEGLQERLKKL